MRHVDEEIVGSGQGRVDHEHHRHDDGGEEGERRGREQPAECLVTIFTPLLLRRLPLCEHPADSSVEHDRKAEDGEAGIQEDERADRRLDHVRLVGEPRTEARAVPEPRDHGKGDKHPNSRAKETQDHFDHGSRDAQDPRQGQDDHDEDRDPDECVTEHLELQIVVFRKICDLE